MIPVRMVIHSDGSEQVAYNDGVHAYSAYDRDIDAYPDRSVIWHWHEDLELVHVTEGTMLYGVGSERIRIDTGDAIFVNACHLHSLHAADAAPCRFTVVMLHPKLLWDCPLPVSSSVLGLTQCNGFSHRHLRNPSAPDRAIIECAQELKHFADAADPSAMLGILARAAELVRLLIGMIPENTGADRPDRHLAQLNAMIAYVQAHHRERISLKEIAGAAYISSSGCEKLFRQYIGMTPLRYLMQYRLERAAALLSDPEPSITEIALSCGFGGSSYFAEAFRARYSTTPGEYRRSRSESLSAVRSIRAGGGPAEHEDSGSNGSRTDDDCE